jgi:hypothetical protein
VVKSGLCSKFKGASWYGKTDVDVHQELYVDATMNVERVLAMRKL